MQRAKELLKIVALVLLIDGMWRARHLPAHLDGVLTRFEVTESKINASAQHLDDATRTWADASREQAASITGLVSDARRTLGTANAQLEHVAPLLDETRVTIAQARVTIAGAGEDVRALAASGQQVAETAQRSIAAVEPVVAHVDAEVTAVSPDLNRMIRASADTVEHVDGIADNGQKMTTRLEHDFDAKRPWWKKALPVLTDSAKLAECFTRGNCF